MYLTKKFVQCTLVQLSCKMLRHKNSLALMFVAIYCAHHVQGVPHNIRGQSVNNLQNNYTSITNDNQKHLNKGISPPKHDVYGNFNRNNRPQLAKGNTKHIFVQGIPSTRSPYSMLKEFWSKLWPNRGRKFLTHVYAHKTYINKRRHQVKQPVKQPKSPGPPYWKTVVSRAWSMILDWLPLSNKRMSRRRVDTGRQDTRILSSAEFWAIPATTIGMMAILRDPIKMAAKQILGKLSSKTP